MIDITEVKDGDIQLFNTQTGRAANILSVQLDALEYLPDFGIDLRYFLAEDFRVQNESFKAYLVEVLANHGVNVTSVLDVIEALAHNYIFNLTPEDQSSGMIAR